MASSKASYRPGEEAQGSKKRARSLSSLVPLSTPLSLFSRAFPAPTTSLNDEHDEHDDHDDQEDAGRRAEVAQMRDDENIGSISKFYFGASAERTLSPTRSSPRVTRTLLVQRERATSLRAASLSVIRRDDSLSLSLSVRGHTE